MVVITIRTCDSYRHHMALYSVCLILFISYIRQLFHSHIHKHDYLSQVKRKKKKVKWSRYRPGVAQRVGRGIALLLHDRGTRRGWVISSTPRPHFTPGKDPVPIVQKAGWATGSVWTGGKSRPHRESKPRSALEINNNVMYWKVYCCRFRSPGTMCRINWWTITDVSR